MAGILNISTLIVEMIRLSIGGVMRSRLAENLRTLVWNIHEFQTMIYNDNRWERLSFGENQVDQGNEVNGED